MKIFSSKRTLFSSKLTVKDRQGTQKAYFTHFSEEKAR